MTIVSFHFILQHCKIGMIFRYNHVKYHFSIIRLNASAKENEMRCVRERSKKDGKEKKLASLSLNQLLKSPMKLRCRKRHHLFKKTMRLTLPSTGGGGVVTFSPPLNIGTIHKSFFHSFLFFGNPSQTKRFLPLPGHNLSTGSFFIGFLQIRLGACAG